MKKTRGKNFLPALILALFFWTVWGFVLFKIPPAFCLSLIPFYLSLFLAVFLTSALILGNSRRGLFLALLLILFLFFRYYQLANPLNIFLLLAIFLILELYFS